MDTKQVPEKMPKPAYYVNLPHTWNAIDGQDGGGDYYRGTCFYMKTLTREDIPDGERHYLEICGANSSAAVYVDGKLIARHHGGYSAWRADLTDALKGKQEALLAIRVDNGANDEVYPQMADFTFYGGLYRDVNLIAVPESHFDLMYFGGPGIAVTPEIEGKQAQVKTKVFLDGVKKGQKLRYTLRDAQEHTIGQIETDADTTECVMTIEDVHLWHGRKDPYLYAVTAELLEGDVVLDRTAAHFGVRSFTIDPQKGFILNGQRYPLRGVSRHQDWKDIGNALLPEHHLRDMELIEELGATTIRLAHYQHAEMFYNLCDQRGMIVWAEIPYISRHMPGGRENALQQMREMIVQNYNHPSIVVWGLSNEITMNGDQDEDMLSLHRALNDLCHELDKTRPTAVAAVSMCPADSPYLQIPDVVSWNHYFGWYGGDTEMNGPWMDKFHAQYPKLPVGLSEYGCEALDWHTSEPVQGDYTEEYQAQYHEKMIRQIAARDYLWATHVWNMFDFGADNRMEGGENGQNHKGLVTFDRRYKKDAFYAYKAWLSDEPFVHICGRRYVNRAETVTKVRVYSNQPEVELYADGKCIGRQKREDHFFGFDVPLEGTVRLEARAGACTDSIILRKVEAFHENYRLKEKGAVLNWFDVTQREGFFSLNDRIEEIMKTEAGRELLAGLMHRMMKDGKNAAGFDMTPEMMQMLGGFTVLRMTGLMGAMDVKFTKEQLLELNAQLNRIKKP